MEDIEEYTHRKWVEEFHVVFFSERLQLTKDLCVQASMSSKPM